MEGIMNIVSRAGVAALGLLLTVPAFAQPMTAVLKLKERVTMQQLAESVQNRLSARYQKFYSPEEIKQLAGPTDEQYQELLKEVKAQGFTVVSESPTHLWISVKGDSAQFEKAFATQISTEKTGVRHLMMAATIPSKLSLVESVSGLDNTRKSFPKFVRSSIRPMASADAGGVPQQTIKDAYGFSPLYAAGLSGKGQHIAIATYDGFHADNVNKFYSLSNLKPGPTVDQVAFNGTANYDEGSAMETELDAEFTGMMAPGANVHVFASATNDDAGELQMFTAILDDNRAKIVNYSWGSCETGLSSQHVSDMTTVFARAVAQGVNIMVASGDSGSDSCQDSTTAADWPAAAPYVVAVGGTTFAQNGSALAETGWSGSGGGISNVWDLPSWQKNLGSQYNKRSYPDVSFNADPSSGQAIWSQEYGQAGWYVIGGTSMAAPQWSGFMALVGEARQKNGAATVGFLNPIIYGFADADRAATFHDITSGTNGAFSAGPGWDAVTGLGSMQADALLNRLSK
jgi:kumamolisin